MFMCDLLLATTKERLVEETKLFYGLMKAMGFTGNVKVQSAVLQLFLEVRLPSRPALNLNHLEFWRGI